MTPSTSHEREDMAEMRRIPPLSLYPWLALKARPGPTMAEIALEVAERCQITVADMRSPTRARRVSWPRQEAMARIRDLGGRSYPQIGAFFNRDHTTAMHSVKRHRERMEAAEAEAREDARWADSLARDERRGAA